MRWLRKIFRFMIITKTSDKGMDFIKRFEGCKLKAYQCSAGVWTIGYGHTKNVKEGMIITQEDAERFLSLDLIKFESEIVENCTLLLNQREFDALVSFCFNVGVGAFKNSTLLKHLNNNDVDLAAEEFVKWNKARVNGKLQPVSGLTRRRKAERLLFNKGIYN